MRTIIVIFGIFLAGCSLIGQQKNEETKKDREFLELLNKSKQIQSINQEKIQEADKKTSQIIQRTSSQIVSLKKEVKQLKSELNEANKKLDSVRNDNIDIKFSLLPVSSGKENW